jgi:hypothetical protein
LSIALCDLTPEQVDFLNNQISEGTTDPSEYWRSEARQFLIFDLYKKGNRRQMCMRQVQGILWSNKEITLKGLFCGLRFHKCPGCSTALRLALLEANQHLCSLDDGRAYSLLSICYRTTDPCVEVLRPAMDKLNKRIRKELSRMDLDSFGTCFMVQPLLEDDSISGLEVKFLWYGPPESAKEFLAKFSPSYQVSQQDLSKSPSSQGLTEFKRSLEFLILDESSIPEDPYQQAKCEAIFNKRRQFNKLGIFYGAKPKEPVAIADLSVYNEMQTDNSPDVPPEPSQSKPKDPRIWRRTPEGRLVYAVKITRWLQEITKIEDIPSDSWGWAPGIDPATGSPGHY